MLRSKAKPDPDKLDRNRIESFNHAIYVDSHECMPVGNAVHLI